MTVPSSSSSSSSWASGHTKNHPKQKSRRTTTLLWVATLVGACQWLLNRRIMLPLFRTTSTTRATTTMTGTTTHLETRSSSLSPNRSDRVVLVDHQRRQWNHTAHDEGSNHNHNHNTHSSLPSHGPTTQGPNHAANVAHETNNHTVPNTANNNNNESSLSPPQQPQQQQQSQPQSFRMIGSWMGNTWIPPPSFKLYSVSEVQALWAGHRLLVLGDSTARQAAMTLFALLNHTTTTSSDNSNDTVPAHLLNRDLNLNRVNQTEPCHRPWWNARRLAQVLVQPRHTICRRTNNNNHPTTDVTFVRTNCLQHVVTFLNSELSHHSKHGSGGRILPHYDVVLLNLGIWHHSQPQQCAKPTISSRKTNATTRLTRNITTLVQQVHALTQQVLAVQSSTLHVIWQTSGYSSSGRAASADDQPAVQEFNRALVHQIMEHYQQAQTQQQQERQAQHSHNHNHTISYVQDFARVMEPRSFGEDRIEGDSHAHYGLAGRLVWIQLLANHWNHLQTQQQQQQQRQERQQAEQPTRAE